MDRRVAGRMGRTLGGLLASVALIAGSVVAGSPAASAATIAISCTAGAAPLGVRILTQQTLTFTMQPSPSACGSANISSASVGSLSMNGGNIQPGYVYTPVVQGPVTFTSNVAGTAVVGFINGPMVTITVAAPSSTDVLMTLTYDAAGGSCAQATGQAYQGDWLALPTSASCARSGYTLTGWSTGPNGTGTVFAPGQTVQVLSYNTLHAVWTSDGSTAPAASTTPGAPQGVTLRTRANLGAGTMSIDVSWKPGTGTATQTVATASTGQSCTSTGQSCTIEGIRPATAVSITAVASNSDASSEPSAAASVPMLAIAVRARPGGGTRRDVAVLGTSSGLPARASIDVWVRQLGSSQFTRTATRPVDAQGRFTWRGALPVGSTVVAMNVVRSVLSAPISVKGA